MMTFSSTFLREAILSCGWDAGARGAGRGGKGRRRVEVVVGTTTASGARGAEGKGRGGYRAASVKVWRSGVTETERRRENLKGVAR